MNLHIDSNIIKSYTKERKRLNRVESKFHFLKQCLNTNVCPKYLQIKTSFPDQRLTRIVNICQIKLIRAEIRNARRQLSHQGNLVYKLYNIIVQRYSPLEADAILRRTSLFTERQSTLSRMTQDNKLRHLSTTNISQPPNTTSNAKSSRFLNLSHYSPSPQEEAILNISPKFAYSNATQPINKLIPAFEQAISQLPVNKQVDARIIIHRSLSDHQTKKQNKAQLNQLKTIAQLKANHLINIIPADKSNQLVILDRSDFVNKANKCISDMKSIKIAKDPTSGLITKLAALKKIKDIPPEILQHCFPPIYPAIPKLFFQIKIHKKDHPLRPLVARFNAPTYNIEKATTKFLQPYFDSHPYTVKSSYQFKSKTQDISLPDNCTLHTMDAIQLFPSVPTEIAKNLILERLQQQGTAPNVILAISSVLKLILQSTFFTFNNQIYKQTQGAPMGLSLSPLLAEAILQQIEILTFSIERPPVIYLRYVDDVFLVIDENINNFQTIFNHFNQQFSTIKFTTDTTTDNCLPFLDLKIHIINNKIDLEIYRKPTQSTNIIPFNSNHPNSHKWAYFNSIIYRAINLPTAQHHINTEIAHIKQIAISNHYPIATIKKIISNTYNIRQNKHNNLNSSNTPVTTFKYVKIPFIPQIHKPLNKLLKNTNYRITYEACTSIKTLIKNDRQSTKPSGGVYLIPFQDSNKVYIGRTKRNLQIRLKEHLYNLKSGNQDTALTQFVNLTNLPPLLSEARIILSPPNIHQLNISEAIEIFRHQPNAINSSPALIIDLIWKDLLFKTNQQMRLRLPSASNTYSSLPANQISFQQTTEEEDNEI